MDTGLKYLQSEAFWGQGHVVGYRYTNKYIFSVLCQLTGILESQCYLNLFPGKEVRCKCSPQVMALCVCVCVCWLGTWENVFLCSVEICEPWYHCLHVMQYGV